MTPVATLMLIAVMIATSMLSGVFGMAGGLVLIGVLLVMLPLPEAMALHAVTQIASNAWRAGVHLGHVRWRIVAAYAAGCLAATALWSLILFVPSKPLALLALGLSPFALKLLPAGWTPDPERPSHGVACGLASMSLMLLTGVAGPLLDAFFLAGSRLDRHAILSTKAVCQVQAHGWKLLYFGGLVAGAGSLDSWLAIAAVLASMVGTLLARPLLAAMTDTQYRRWAGRLVTSIAGAYVIFGAWLMAIP